MLLDAMPQPKKAQGANWRSLKELNIVGHTQDNLQL